MSDAAPGAHNWDLGAVRARPSVLARPGDGIVSVLLALTVFVVFAPALDGSFVDWDDYRNFLENPHYRGLGAEHIRWMFMSIHTGHWIPITWLTLGLDYVIWGLDPFGYHLTSLLLHCVNAALFFLLAVRVLARAHDAPPATLRLGAVIGTLAFALHPLRVESVAWVTERRDVVSGMFALLTVLAYLQAHHPETRVQGRWRLVALLSFAVAMMSKSIVVSLPVVLLVLDAYPLRRVGWGRWKDARDVLREKLPFVVLAGVGASIAILAGRVNGILTPLEAMPVTERFGLAMYSIWFYVSRTVVPFGLSPLHGLPPSVDLIQPGFLGSILGVAFLGALAVWWRSRAPALAAALVSYVVMVAPVSGILHNGAQIVAERYSYLSCMPWAIVLGGGAGWLVRGGGALPVASRWLVGVATALWLVWLSTTTVNQIGVWSNTQSLWRAALAADPGCSACHFEYAVHLRKSGDPERAMEHLTQSLALSPTHRTLKRYLVQSVLVRYDLNEIDKAHEELAVLTAISPDGGETVGRLIVSDW